MNANRTVMGAVVNILAIALFVFAHKIWWPQTIVMLLGTSIGGYYGARMVKGESGLRPRIGHRRQHGNHHRVFPGKHQGLVAQASACALFGGKKTKTGQAEACAT